MGEVNPDVLAQMHRIHRATNDGTFNKDEINDALKQLHDFLTGAAYEAPRDPIEDAGSTHEEEVGEEGGGEEGDEDAGEDHPHKRKSRKKR